MGWPTVWKLRPAPISSGQSAYSIWGMISAFCPGMIPEIGQSEVSPPHMNRCWHAGTFACHIPCWPALISAGSLGSALSFFSFKCSLQLLISRHFSFQPLVSAITKLILTFFHGFQLYGNKHLGVSAANYFTWSFLLSLRVVLIPCWPGHATSRSRPVVSSILHFSLWLGQVVPFLRRCFRYPILFPFLLWWPFLLICEIHKLSCISSSGFLSKWLEKLYEVGGWTW